jgi:hypothetical protein
MKIELRELMDDNEMLSHIFLGCLNRQQLEKIKEKYVGKDGCEIDWQKESVKIPVEMKIAGVSINPKEFFDEWKNQMQRLIHEEASKLLSEKFGKDKLSDLSCRIGALENIIQDFESEVTWESENPFLK